MWRWRKRSGPVRKAPHPPPAVDRLKNAPIEEVVITNTLPVPGEADGFDKLEVLSVAPIVAEALQAIFIDSSVSEIFLGENA